MRIACQYLLAVLLLSLFSIPCTGADYRQVAGVIDTRTVFSDGELTVDGLVKLARSRGLEAVFFNDHDRLVMEYGLFPLQHILRRRETLNSIQRNGVGRYLAAIREAASRYPEMVLVPGCESTPYYYWTGSYFSGNLTANDYEKRILAVGLDRRQDYDRMPILHNGFSTRYVKQAIPRLLVFFGAFVIGVVMLLERRPLRRMAGIVLCSVSLLLMVNTMPFRSSPYDQYMGDQGIAPYQRYIGYVASIGGMTFWNYPETHSGDRPLGPIRLHTPPYPEVLEQSTGYTGFAALYGDTSTVTEPGHEWDRVLLDYCRGRRRHPAWGISTADYHSDTGAGGKLGNFATIFLVKQKSKAAVLEAMRNGRMYAVRGRYPQRLALEAFSVSAAGADKEALLGQEAVLDAAPRIHLALSSKIATGKPVTVRLIRGGKLVDTFRAHLPLQRTFTDESCPRGRKTYYRINARGPAGSLVSNPVFVTVRPIG